MTDQNGSVVGTVGVAKLNQLFRDGLLNEATFKINGIGTDIHFKYGCMTGYSQGF